MVLFVKEKKKVVEEEEEEEEEGRDIEGKGESVRLSITSSQSVSGTMMGEIDVVVSGLWLRHHHCKQTRARSTHWKGTT